MTLPSLPPIRENSDDSDEFFDLDIKAALYPASFSSSPAPEALQTLQHTAERTIRDLHSAYKQRTLTLHAAVYEKRECIEQLEWTRLSTCEMESKLETMTVRAREQDTKMKKLADDLRRERLKVQNLEEEKEDRRKEEEQQQQQQQQQHNGEQQNKQQSQQDKLPGDSKENPQKRDSSGTTLFSELDETSDHDDSDSSVTDGSVFSAHGRPNRFSGSSSTCTSPLASAADVTFASSSDKTAPVTRGRRPPSPTPSTMTSVSVVPSTLSRPTSISGTTLSSFSDVATSPSVPSLSTETKPSSSAYDRVVRGFSLTTSRFGNSANRPKSTASNNTTASSLSSMSLSSSSSSSSSSASKSCRNCNGMASIDTWNIINVLQEENRGLKGRIGHLEHAMDDCIVSLDTYY